MDGTTFASFLNAAGAGVAAIIITSLVQLVKTALPSIGERVSGALMAFVASAVLYLLTAVATGVSTFDSGLNVFLAWLTCATAAVGAYSVVRHAQDVRSEGS